MVEARPQTIAFRSAPSSPVSDATVTVLATATSGLSIRYSSLTPDVCNVGGAAGNVTALAAGTCTIAADQPGDDRYAPAPRATLTIEFAFGAGLVFGPAPTLSVFDSGTVVATGGNTSPAYASSTPAICSVDPPTGWVTALSAGTCQIVATAGEALRAELSMPISAPSQMSVPSAPTGVTAAAGSDPSSVAIRIGGTASGGAPITQYFVQSVPKEISASGPTSPIVVTCPYSCNGYAFSVSASNMLGTGPASAPANVITAYRVEAVFREPDTQPNDTIFVGSFTFDATTRTVATLQGKLSEAMTGGLTGYPNDTMTWVPLTYQLSSVPVTFDDVEGQLVTSFLLDQPSTLSDDPALDSDNGASPGTRPGLYYGYPGSNPGNAYVRLFVNTANPLAPIPSAAIDKLAYADCAAGGMMGATCMTGMTVAGYGTIGTMSGYPVSQQVAHQ